MVFPLILSTAEAGRRMLFPLYKWKRLGSDTLNYLSRAIQLKSDGAELQTQLTPQ